MKGLCPWPAGPSPLLREAGTSPGEGGAGVTPPLPQSSMEPRTDNTPTGSPGTPRPAELCHIGPQGTPAAPVGPILSGQPQVPRLKFQLWWAGARGVGPNLHLEEVPKEEQGPE